MLADNLNKNERKRVFKSNIIQYVDEEAPITDLALKNPTSTDLFLIILEGITGIKIKRERSRGRSEQRSFFVTHNPRRP